MSYTGKQIKKFIKICYLSTAVCGCCVALQLALQLSRKVSNFEFPGNGVTTSQHSKKHSQLCVASHLSKCFARKQSRNVTQLRDGQQPSEDVTTIMNNLAALCFLQPSEDFCVNHVKSPSTALRSNGVKNQGSYNGEKSLLSNRVKTAILTESPPNFVFSSIPAASGRISTVACGNFFKFL